MPGAVASNHPLSTAAGESILARGGNAYDALIATSAALTVVQPHTNGLGSDFFAVVHDGAVRTVNGSGPAAAAASIDRLRELGHTRMPESGPLSCLTVPGLVGSWTLLAERTSLPFRDLLAPAIRLAEEGFPATESLARSCQTTAARADADWHRIYGGVRSGGILRQPDLGRTLTRLQEDRGHAFYHGAVAREIAADAQRKGGLLAFPDLDAYRAEWRDPLSIRYRGHEVFTTPPNSQGATALLWLNLLARHDLAAASEAEFLDHLLRTLPIAYSYRARYIGDPARVGFPPELLEPDYAYAAEAPPPVGTDAQGDTTAFSVTDGTIGISAIQSNYMGFGSGQTVAGTGINLHNRASYFTLDPHHHNALAPGARTFHTLMALYVRRPDAELFLSTMGADVQPQTNVQILTRVLDRGLGIRAAIEAPRFALPASIYRSAELFVEDGLSIPGARRLGAERSLVGHAQGILSTDHLEVGIDPRGDGRVDASGRAPAF